MISSSYYRRNVDQKLTLQFSEERPEKAVILQVICFCFWEPSE